MITRCTQSERAGRPGRAKGIESATLVVAILAASAAQASTISGTVNTGGTGSNPANFSGDTVTFLGAPAKAPFPTLTVGEFDFTVPGGQAVTAGSFSGDFGSSNILFSGTSQAALFVDGVQLALCNASCEAASTSNDVAWLYSLTASDLALLSTNSLWEAGKAVITASQLSASQVVLDPTTVNLTLTPVPIPPALFLFASALAPLFGFARRKAVAA